MLCHGSVDRGACRSSHRHRQTTVRLYSKPTLPDWIFSFSSCLSVCLSVSLSLSLTLTLTLILSLCLHFNDHFDHFPGGPGLAGTRMSPFCISLELRMMEVVSGDYWRYKTYKAPKCHRQQTNTQFFTGRMSFLSPNQHVSKH